MSITCIDITTAKFSNLAELVGRTKAIDLLNKYGSYEAIPKSEMTGKNYSKDPKTFNEVLQAFTGEDYDVDNTDKNLNRAATMLQVDYDPFTDVYRYSINGVSKKLNLLKQDSSTEDGVYISQSGRVNKTQHLIETIKNELKPSFVSDTKFVKNNFSDILSLTNLISLKRLYDNKLEQYSRLGTIRPSDQAELDYLKTRIEELSISVANFEISNKDRSELFNRASLQLSMSLKVFGTHGVDYTIQKFKDPLLDDFIIIKDKHGVYSILSLIDQKVINHATKDFLGSSLENGSSILRNANSAIYNNRLSYEHFKLYMAYITLKNKGLSVDTVRLLELPTERLVDIDENKNYYSDVSIQSFSQQMDKVLEEYAKQTKGSLIANQINDYLAKTKEDKLGLLDTQNSTFIESVLLSYEKKFFLKGTTMSELISNAEWKRIEALILKRLDTISKKADLTSRMKLEQQELYDVLSSLRNQEYESQIEIEDESDVNLTTNFFRDTRQIKNKYIQQFQEIIDELISKTKQILNKFKQNHDNVADALVKTRFNNVNKVNPYYKEEEIFKNILHGKSGYIYIDPRKHNGLWASSNENIAGWYKLSNEEKDYSNFFVKNLRDSYVDMYTELYVDMGKPRDVSEQSANDKYETDWEDGQIPIIKKRADRQLVSNLFSGNVNFNWSAVKDGFKRTIQHATDFNQIQNSAESDGIKNYYMFYTKDEHNERVIETIEKYGDIETNLYQVLNMAFTNNTKRGQMDKLKTWYKTIKAMAANTLSEDGKQQNKNTLNFLDGMYEHFVRQENRKISTGSSKYNQYKTLRRILKGAGLKNTNVDMVLSAFNKYNSMLTVMLVPTKDLYNFIQGFVRALSRAFSGTIQQLLYGIEAKFTLKDFGEGLIDAFQAISSGDHRLKIQLMMKEMNAYQSDFDDYSNPRYRATDKRFYTFRSSALYSLNYLGDYFNRTLVATAMAKKMGIWDAYSVQDGVLVYDKTKDTRDEKIKQHVYDNNGNEKSAFDFRLRTNIRYLSNVLYGTYDEDTLRMIEMYSLGKAVMQFKRYLPNYIFESFTKGRYLKAVGEYKIVNDNVMWSNTFEEGVFNSLGAMFLNRGELNRMYKILMKKDIATSDIDKKRIANICKLVADLSFFMSLLILHQLFKGDDDDDENKYGLYSNRYNYKRFSQLQWDFVQTINPNTYVNILHSPYSAAKKIKQLLRMSGDVANYPFSGKMTDKEYDNMKNRFFKMTPFVSSGYNTYVSFEDVLYDTSDKQLD